MLEGNAAIVYLILLFSLLVVIGMVYQVYRCRLYSHNSVAPIDKSMGGSIDSVNTNSSLAIAISEIDDETTALLKLGQSLIYNRPSANQSRFESVPSLPPTQHVYLFDENDMQCVERGDLAVLMTKFDEIVTKGANINLRTTKGPRPITFCMMNDEIRWQAIKDTKKRFKMSIKDVLNIELDRRRNSFRVDKSSPSRYSFSISTNKTSLSLEFENEIDRICFMTCLSGKIEKYRKDMI